MQSHVKYQVETREVETQMKRSKHPKTDDMAATHMADPYPRAACRGALVHLRRIPGENRSVPRSPVRFVNLLATLCLDSGCYSALWQQRTPVLPACSRTVGDDKCFT
jgi:hypothetical protein